ncbi:hypothetical protein AHAS_Ahas01G0113700 [Arachis hypogaea]
MSFFSCCRCHCRLRRTISLRHPLRRTSSLHRRSRRVYSHYRKALSAAALIASAPSGRTLSGRPLLSVEGSFTYYHSTAVSFLSDYDLLGRTKDQIKTIEQVNVALVTCNSLKLDGFVISGGILTFFETSYIA